MEIIVIIKELLGLLVKTFTVRKNMAWLIAFIAVLGLLGANFQYRAAGTDVADFCLFTDTCDGPGGGGGGNIVTEGPLELRAIEESVTLTLPAIRGECTFGACYYKDFPIKDYTYMAYVNISYMSGAPLLGNADLTVTSPGGEVYSNIGSTSEESVFLGKETIAENGTGNWQVIVKNSSGFALQVWVSIQIYDYVQEEETSEE